MFYLNISTLFTSMTLILNYQIENVNKMKNYNYLCHGLMKIYSYLILIFKTIHLLHMKYYHLFEIFFN